MRLRKDAKTELLRHAPLFGNCSKRELAAIGAMQMLLAQLGETEAAAKVDRGIRHATSKMKSMRAGEMGYATSEVGDLVVDGASG